MHGWVGNILRVEPDDRKDLARAARSRARPGVHRRARPRHEDPVRRGRSPGRSALAGQQAHLRSRAIHRHLCALRRPLRCRDQGAADRRRGLGELRRHVGARAQVRRVRRRHLRGQGAQAGLPVDQGRHGRDPRRGALWGKTVPDTTEAIRAETDEDAKIACIGPAGENQVLFAAIMNDMHRAAGRSGVGAVMGSKNLKAVAVRGTGAVRCADAAAFNRAVLDVRAKIHAHPVGGTGLRLYGTDVLTNILNEIGGYPTRNFQDGHFPTADKSRRRVAVGARSCSDPRAASPASSPAAGSPRSPTTKYAGEGEGPEYETAWGFGGRLRHRRPRCGDEGELLLQRVRHGHHHAWARPSPARWSCTSWA